MQILVEEVITGFHIVFFPICLEKSKRIHPKKHHHDSW